MEIQDLVLKTLQYYQLRNPEAARLRFMTRDRGGGEGMKGGERGGEIQQGEINKKPQGLHEVNL